MAIFSAISSTISKILSQLQENVNAPTSPEVSFTPTPEPPSSAASTELTSPGFARRLDIANSGSLFAQHIMNVPPTQAREDAILSEVLSGNLPEFFRNFVELTIVVNDKTIRYLVSPDFLCVGSDVDFLRVPLNPITAQKIASTFDCTLPTPKMALQIWKAASVKLTPSPNGPPYDATMISTDAFVKHNAKIEKARAGQALGKLVAGHKKDVVICKHLLADPSRVAIYGWFQPNGIPIQDLNPVSHDKLYRDYSHGIRLVFRKVLVNDQSYDLFDLLNNSALSSLVSDEGPYDASTIYQK